MAIRSHHYDAAFEAYLRSIRLPYVAVDEARRTLLADSSLKSFDFIVSPPGGDGLLVDVKGRRFPTTGSGGGHCWENWVTRDDLHSLMQWQQVFGGRFRAVLVFAYDVQAERWRARHESLFGFREREYAFYGVWADDYVPHMVRRSPQWDTVSLPAAEFRRLRRPVEELFGLALPPLLESTG